MSEINSQLLFARIIHENEKNERETKKKSLEDSRPQSNSLSVYFGEN